MYKIITTTTNFAKVLKYYVVKRKFRKLLNDLNELKEDLTNGVFKGDVLQGIIFDEFIGGTYKKRMVDSTNNIGASGGFRIVYCINHDIKKVYLLTIYHKRDMKNISKDEVNQLIENGILEYE